MIWKFEMQGISACWPSVDYAWFVPCLVMLLNTEHLQICVFVNDCTWTFWMITLTGNLFSFAWGHYLVDQKYSKIQLQKFNRKEMSMFLMIIMIIDQIHLYTLCKHHINRTMPSLIEVNKSQTNLSFIFATQPCPWCPCCQLNWHTQYNCMPNKHDQIETFVWLDKILF